MRFEEFTQAVVEKIREYFPKTFAEASVEIQTVVKNNDLKLTSLGMKSQKAHMPVRMKIQKSILRILPMYMRKQNL